MVAKTAMVGEAMADKAVVLEVVVTVDSVFHHRGDPCSPGYH